MWRNIMHNSEEILKRISLPEANDKPRNNTVKSAANKFASDKTIFLFCLALEFEMCFLSFLSEAHQIQLHYKINQNKIFCYFVPQMLSQNVFKENFL